MRFLIHRDGRLIGGITCSRAKADELRRHGYILLPA